jgi:hypothetical protein
VADIAEFPRTLLREQTGSWQVVGSTVSPGQSASGVFTRARMDGGGYWRAEYGSINLRTADHVRAWRAVDVLCDSGASPIVVPMCDKRQMPAPIVNGKPLYSYGKISHSDGTLFSDGTGYYQPVVRAVAFNSAALRATTMQIQVLYGSPLRGGEIFSINHPSQGWRCYQIGTVQTNDVGVSTVTFRPPLRDVVASGAVIEFDRPRCTMMLADPNVLKLTMTMRRFANPDASFIEYIFPD